jgi:hypothetical protein
MSDDVFFNKMVTKGLEPIESDGRFFEGFLTVQVKDKQGEVTIVDELYKVLPIWMDRGAPITDTHSNRVVGKGINFARSDYTDGDGTIYPAIKVTGKIYNDYELDNEIWKKIKSGEYKGLSFGGSTKTDRQPMRMKDGSIAYSLSKLEHYEVAVCRDPAVPLAVITDTNPIAKSNMNCDNTGCYVTKPVLGQPNFESAVRNVMEESDVPKKNAERIVGAAEAKAKGNPNLPYNEEFFTKEEENKICPECGKPLKEHGSATDVDTSLLHDDPKDHIPPKKKVKPKKVVKGNNIKPMTCPHCGESTQDAKGRFPKYGHINHHTQHDSDTGKYSIDVDAPEWNTFSDYDDDPHGMRVPEGNDLVNIDPIIHHYAHRVHQGKTKKIKHPNVKNRLANTKEQMEAHFSNVNQANKGQKIKKGKQVKARKKRKKESQGIGNKRGWGAYKSLVETNKILGKYQGNVLKLSRILDKDAPADIKIPSGNVPKKKEPKGQSHGAQSTAERERGVSEQLAEGYEHYSEPLSLDPKRTIVPHEELGSWEFEKPEYKRSRRPYEALIAPNARLADPRKRKSWAKIQAKIKNALRPIVRVSLPVTDSSAQSAAAEGIDTGSDTVVDDPKASTRKRQLAHDKKIRERKRRIFHPERAADPKKMIATQAQIDAKNIKNAKITNQKIQEKIDNKN